ncbi:MAG: hypothetical protein QOE45_2838 [Frankiaceae bacterium]|jgi:hypothetical protein|nr:hypothetical protein [Frankiaceae bacterium]
MLPVVLPPHAACVQVVVDYGTAAKAPAGPHVHCTRSAVGDTGAEVLAQRHNEVDATHSSTQPRYNGNFLCAIDGYPESGCGDHGTEPYWSVWLWQRGAWVYSQRGVDSYTTEDADRDGCQDPLGFRYTPFESKERPRATPPKCAVATQPPVTRPPSTSRPVATATARATATTGPRPTTGPTRPSGTPSGVPTSAMPAPGGGGGPASTPSTLNGTALGPATAPPGVPARPDGGLPWPTILGGLVAAGLLCATFLRLRRPS